MLEERRLVIQSMLGKSALAGEDLLADVAGMYAVPHLVHTVHVLAPVVRVVEDLEALVT